MSHINPSSIALRARAQAESQFHRNEASLLRTQHKYFLERMESEALAITEDREYGLDATDRTVATTNIVCDELFLESLWSLAGDMLLDSRAIRALFSRGLIALDLERRLATAMILRVRSVGRCFVWHRRRHATLVRHNLRSGLVYRSVPDEQGFAPQLYCSMLRFALSIRFPHRIRVSRSVIRQELLETVMRAPPFFLSRLDPVVARLLTEWVRIYNFSQRLGLTIGQLHRRPAPTTDHRIDDLVKKLNIAREVFSETNDNLSHAFIYDDYTRRQRHERVWSSLDFYAGRSLKDSLSFDTTRCYSSFEAGGPFSFCFLGATDILQIFTDPIPVPRRPSDHERRPFVLELNAMSFFQGCVAETPPRPELEPAKKEKRKTRKSGDGRAVEQVNDVQVAKPPERVLVYCEKEVRETFLRIWSTLSQGKLIYRDIEYALTRIGFALDSREGSRVEFKVPDGCTVPISQERFKECGWTPLVLHGPHGKDSKGYSDAKRISLRNFLEENYGWTNDSFILRSPVQEA